jgi:hypothetical protein
MTMVGKHHEEDSNDLGTVYESDRDCIGGSNTWIFSLGSRRLSMTTRFADNLDALGSKNGFLHAEIRKGVIGDGNFFYGWSWQGEWGTLAIHLTSHQRADLALGQNQTRYADGRFSEFELLPNVTHFALRPPPVFVEFRLF